MGLTVHWTMTLPREAPEVQVRFLMERFRQKCLDLPFEEVDRELFVAAGEACHWEKAEDEGQWWMLIQAREVIVCRPKGRRLVRATFGGTEPGALGLDLLPRQVIGFGTRPGKGCESAEFTICRYPDRLEHQDRYMDTSNLGWKGHGHCKTQYASDPEAGGVENFLKCHMAMIAALDAARMLGFGVEVSDEGEYWKKRDVKALTETVGTWNRAIAGMVGMLKDALAGNPTFGMDAAIAKRKDFERLEHEARRLPMSDGEMKAPVEWQGPGYYAIKDGVALFVAGPESTTAKANAEARRRGLPVPLHYVIEERRPHGPDDSLRSPVSRGCC